MLEAHLIFFLEREAVNPIGSNMNWLMDPKDGGEGPTREDEAHIEHYVYLALTPDPPPAESAHPPDEEPEPLDQPYEDLVNYVSSLTPTSG